MFRMYSVLLMYNRINLDNSKWYISQDYFKMLSNKFFEWKKFANSIYNFNVRLDKHYKEKNKEVNDPQ